MHSVSVEETINDEQIDKFIAYHCERFAFDKDNVRVFYCEGIKTYKFVPCGDLLDDSLYSGFYLIDKNMQLKYKYDISSGDKPCTLNTHINTSTKVGDLFIFKKAFTLYNQKANKIIYFKPITKKTQLKDIIEYIQFIFGKDVKIQNIWYVKKSFLKSINKGKSKKPIRHNNHSFALTYLFLVYILFCFMALAYIVFVSNRSANTHQSPNKKISLIKYDKDTYLGIIRFLNLLKNKKIQIQSISLRKNKLNVTLISKSNKTLLKFVTKHKKKIKLKNIRKVGKVYIMDIIYAF